MKLNVVIVGYGNLGKSLEKELRTNGAAELKAVYSRRNISHPLYRPFASLNDCSDADVALIALGSYSDLTENTQKLLNLDTVDSYDVHADIAEYKKKLSILKPNRLSLIAAGWDPGLLSLMRGIYSAAGGKTLTLWGKGVSQGHSNAIRSIDGVIDAVQFTVPTENAEKQILNGIDDSRKLIKRECYVACVEKDKDEIKRTIKNMPQYFADYETEVTFCSPKEVRELKKRTRHKGTVFCNGEGFNGKAQISMESNTDFTAKIMIAYALAVPALKRDGYKGALDVFDIPLKYLADKTLI